MNFKYLVNKINKTMKITKISLVAFLEALCLSLLIGSTALAFSSNISSVSAVSPVGHTNGKNKKIENRILQEVTTGVSSQNIATSVANPRSNTFRGFGSQFNRDYEFVFFYSNSCQHCKRFEPVLKKYSDSTGISVKGFLIDGKSLSALPSRYFPNSIVVGQEMVERFFGKGSSISVPTLFILNKHNLHAYPVSKGALSYLEISRRMDELKPRILRNEMNGSNKSNEYHMANRGNKEYVRRVDRVRGRNV